MQLKIPAGLNEADVRHAIAGLQVFFRRTGKRKAQAATRVSNLAEFASLEWESMIRGFAFARKQVADRQTTELALRFYVQRKVAKSRLKSVYRIPPQMVMVRTRGETIRLKTDVVELPAVPRSHRVVAGGHSIGHFIGRGGTLGCAAVASDATKYAVTCCHVAALSGNANEGDAIESPSDSDGAAGPNTMGTLIDWTPLSASSINSSDFALIKPKAGVELSNAELNLTAGARFANYTIEEYQQLTNHAVTFESRRGTVGGTIDSIHNYLRFAYDEGVFAFGDVVRYAAAVEPGDSGSAVIDYATRSRVLGFHIAGDAGAGYALTSRNLMRAFRSYGLQLAP